jgi:hypothetical protein
VRGAVEPSTTVTDVKDDSDELRYAIEHLKGKFNCQQLANSQVMIDDIDVDDLTAMMVRGNSDTEEEDARTEPASEGEAMETDVHPRP